MQSHSIGVALFFKEKSGFGHGLETNRNFNRFFSP